MLVLQSRARLLFRSIGGFRCVRRMIMESCESESCDNYLVPPEAVRGCTKLDKAAFYKEVEFHCVRISNPKLCSIFIEHLSHARIKCSYVKGIVPVLGTDDSKPKELRIMLGPTHMVQKLLTDEDHSWIAANEGAESTDVMKLGYDDFSRRTILRAILPPELDVASSFEEAGHIAHYNLKQEYLPYKEIIGQVTLDKNKRIRTVVNKVEELGATSAFRFFKMELLAGEDNYIASVHENQCTFTMDYSKVYWNSRLENEHKDVVSLFNKNEVVLDVFAGVGPFAIPAAKRQHCFVHANDLNPHSYKYLMQNVKNNGVSSRVKGYSLDGKEFITTVSRQLIEQSLSSIGDDENVTPYSHVVMNLPGSATKFLEAFRGVFSSIPTELRLRVVLPFIHCYCFADKEGDENKRTDPMENVTAHLGVERLEEGKYSMHKVRSVSPVTLMMRVSFKLPPEVAYMENKELPDNTKERIDVEKTGRCAEGEEAREAFEMENSGTERDCCVVNSPSQQLLVAESRLVDEQKFSRVEQNRKNPHIEEPKLKRLKVENN